MNTNDPVATYGKPMMSDENIASYVQPVSGARLPIIGQASIFVEGACAARRFYENLITTGKLRVVEEAEWDMSIPRDPCCPFCNYGWEGLGDVHFDRDFKFYPCCGNKIKRPTQQP